MLRMIIIILIAFVNGFFLEGAVMWGFKDFFANIQAAPHKSIIDYLLIGLENVMSAGATVLAGVITGWLAKRRWFIAQFLGLLIMPGIFITAGLLSPNPKQQIQESWSMFAIWIGFFMLLTLPGAWLGSKLVDKTNLGQEEKPTTFLGIEWYLWLLFYVPVISLISAISILAQRFLMMFIWRQSWNPPVFSAMLYLILIYFISLWVMKLRGFLLGRTTHNKKSKIAIIVAAIILMQFSPWLTVPVEYANYYYLKICSKIFIPRDELKWLSDFTIFRNPYASHPDMQRDIEQPLAAIERVLIPGSQRSGKTGGQ